MYLLLGLLLLYFFASRVTKPNLSPEHPVMRGIALAGVIVVVLMGLACLGVMSLPPCFSMFPLPR